MSVGLVTVASAYVALAWSVGGCLGLVSIAGVLGVGLGWGLCLMAGSVWLTHGLNDQVSVVCKRIGRDQEELGRINTN